MARKITSIRTITNTVIVLHIPLKKFQCVTVSVCNTILYNMKILYNVTDTSKSNCVF